MEELKTQDALRTLGFELREVSKRELELSFIALKDKYQTNNNEALLAKVTDAYNYLTKDIRVTNEVIRNILDPSHKTYQYLEKPLGYREEENKTINEPNPEVIDNRPSYNPNQGNIKVADKPSLFIFILSMLMPMYGLLNFSALKRIMPKASKFYLVAGILGLVLEVALIVLILTLPI